MSDPMSDADRQFREAAARAAQLLSPLVAASKAEERFRTVKKEAAIILREFAPLAARLAELEERTRWRACRDELPSLDVPVLVGQAPYASVGTAKVIRYQTTGQMMWSNDNWHRDIPVDDYVVTHWMPLPPAP